MREGEWEGEWGLLIFDKETEEYVGGVILVGFDLATAKAIFNETSDEMLYASYLVTPDHVEPLRRYTDAAIEFQKYDYFLEFTVR